MVSKVGKNLLRVNGITDGDGTTDSTAYLDAHTLVADVRGRDAGSAAFLIRALDRANLPTEVFRVNKDGAFFWAGAPYDTVNYATLQATLNAAPAGAVVNVSSNQTVTATVTVSKAVTIMSTTGATITMQTANTTLFDVSASDVTFQGLTLVGPQGSASQVNERAIDATGTSAASPLTNIRVRDCAIRDWGYYGVYLKWVEGFRLERNDIANVWYAGIGGECVQTGWIEDNVVDGVNGTPNAYGIFVSRPDSSSLVTEPRSADVLIARNIVRDVTVWEGLDTHGGERIHFVDNVVTGCTIGISVGPSNNGSSVETYAPLYCTVNGNTVTSGLTTGAAGPGIQIIGVSGAEHALGVRVIGNTVVGHGYEGINTSGGIICRDTRGLQLIGNDLIECSPHGIAVMDQNRGLVISGGMILDPWSTNNSQAVGVYLQTVNIEGVVGGFSAVTGPKSATHVLDGGAIQAASVASINVALLPFYTNVATRAVIGAAATVARQSDATKEAAFGVARVARPSAFTQTYAASSKVVALMTSATLTDSSGGTPDTTLASIPDPTDAPASADALRDNLVASTLPPIRNDLADLAAQVNALRADLVVVKDNITAIVDDLQSEGWLQ